MEFYIPTKIYHENCAVLNHSTEIASLGRKAFIVTGKSSAVKTRALDDVIKALEDNDTGYILYDKIEENPSVETIMEAADIGREGGADFVIGIGGGSPMDSAKAIALMVQNRDTAEEVLYQELKIKALPVVEVPTTCGTGSEVTPYAILTRNDKKTKQSIKHKISVNGTVDALSPVNIYLLEPSGQNCYICLKLKTPPANGPIYRIRAEISAFDFRKCGGAAIAHRHAQERHSQPTAGSRLSLLRRQGGGKDVLCQNFCKDYQLQLAHTTGRGLRPLRLLPPVRPGTLPEHNRTRCRLS